MFGTEETSQSSALIALEVRCSIVNVKPLGSANASNNRDNDIHMVVFSEVTDLRPKVVLNVKVRQPKIWDSGPKGNKGAYTQTLGC